MGRLELPHLSILEPKSSASTNSATSAALNQKACTGRLKGGALYPNERVLPSASNATEYGILYCCLEYLTS